MVIVFVILHYESLKDTIDCIDSLKKYIVDENVSIVVVDNGSTNGKLKSIKAMYSEKKIHFIYSESNLGFAKGNNLGYMYAKNELKADVIILCNNDLLFKQDDFISRLKDDIKIKKFDIAGPRIISLVDGKNQNPVPHLYPTKKSIKRKILKLQILYFLSYLGLDVTLKKFFSKNIEEVKNWKKEDYQLHGACLIFGPKYIELFDGLYSGTFMYMEEGILKYLAQSYSLNMLYMDNLEVYHKEGSSTKKIYGKGKDKRQFYYKWNIDGCVKLIKLMQTEIKVENHNDF